MEYPFEREPELSESDFSIQQHQSIERIMNLKIDDKREESLKASLSWVEKSINYPFLFSERSTLEGLSRLYSFIVTELEMLEKYDKALIYSEKAIDAMSKCCAFSYSQLYTRELAGDLYQHASLLALLNKNKDALQYAEKSLRVLNIIVDRPDYEPNVNIEDDITNVEEFINELSDI